MPQPEYPGGNWRRFEKGGGFPGGGPSGPANPTEPTESTGPTGPMCSDMGPGWVGDYPNCRYDPSAATDFTGTVDSLGLGDLFADTSLAGEEWKKYFDPYDPRREEFLTRQAGFDISQLESAWGTREEQLGKAWGLQKGQLSEDWRGRKEGIGAEAGSAYRQSFGLGRQAGRKSGMSFSGTATEMERQQTGDISEAYKRSFGLGKTAYEQAMSSGGLGYQQALESGQLQLQQGITDIGQGLESDIFSAQQAWEQRQKDFAFSLLGGDIWNRDDGGGGETGGYGDGNYGGDTPGGGLCVWQCPDGCSYQGECPEGLAEGMYFSSTNCCEGTDTDAPCSPEYNLLGQCVYCCDKV